MRTSNLAKQTIGKGNFIKYLNPSTLMQSKSYKNRNQMSNIHCRSMQQLDLNPNLASQSSIIRQNLKTNIHHSSLFSDKENSAQGHAPNKSRSLSKFITFFQNSNILNSNRKQTQQASKKNQQVKRKNYNGFSYDLKIAPSQNTTSNLLGQQNGKKIIKKKDKQNINEQQLNTLNSNRDMKPEKSRSPLGQRHDIAINNSLNESKGRQQQNLIVKMKQIIQEQKHRQQEYLERIQNYQQKITQISAKNSHLQSLISSYTDQITQLTKKLNSYESKTRQLESKNVDYQQKLKILVNKEKQHKNTNKDKNSAKQQDLVVKSLKKVINQQLNKIIQLERVKLQNQELKSKLNENNSFNERSFDAQNDDQAYSKKEYSFQYDANQSQSQISSNKQFNFEKNSNYGKQTFKKSKPYQKQSFEQQSDDLNNKHFKSFFKIQQSPISSDSNLNFFKSGQIKMPIMPNKVSDKKQGTNMIKITQAESSFSRQAIEQVNEQNDQPEMHSTKKSTKHKNSSKGQSDHSKQQDSILQEVDEYLTKWRAKA